MKYSKSLITIAVAALATTSALADITIGVSLSLTGPTSALGIPIKNAIAMWPTSIGGEKLNVIILDDATDPANATKNARRFATDDKVDILLGSVATPPANAVAAVASETGTMHLAFAPIDVSTNKAPWSYNMPQSTLVMSHALAEHMKKSGVKTLGFLGYTDAYGELWLKEITAQGEKAGIKVVATERFARTDTSVTPQALKLVSANPDAMLVVASGSGAAMPHMALVERGYKGRIYQTHAAATPDLVRIGGKDVEGAFVVSGPAVVAAQLPDSHPSKAVAVDFVTNYEKAYGPGSRNQFAGHSYDAKIMLEKILPVALAKAKPGTPEFRAALRDAVEGMGRTIFSHGVMNWTAADHNGYTNETGVMLKVVNGQFVVEK